MLALAVMVAMVLTGLPNNLPYTVQAEDAVMNSGTLAVDYRSDLKVDAGDDTSTGYFYFKGDTGTLSGSVTAVANKGGVFLNGVAISNYKLQRIATKLYWFDYLEPTGEKLKVGDMIMISGEFSGVDSSNAALKVVFDKTVFQYLGTEENPKGAWAVIDDPAEESKQISLEDFELDTFTANGNTKAGVGGVNLDGKDFVVDIEVSTTATTPSNAYGHFFYGGNGSSNMGLKFSFWSDHKQFVIQNYIPDENGTKSGSVINAAWLPNFGFKEGDVKPMRITINTIFMDSDSDGVKDDLCLNVWMEQEGVNKQIVTDKYVTNAANFGDNVFFSANSTTTMICKNVPNPKEETYLTFGDVGIADGTYTGENAGESTYSGSLAGKTLVGEVSCEWLTEDSPGNAYCSIAYGGTSQKTGLHFAYRFDQNIFIVQDFVANSETYGSLPMKQDAWYLKNYDVTTLGETRLMAIKMAYVDYDKDGVADDACFSVRINNIRLNENVYVKDGLYLLTNKIYVAPWEANRSITVSSISTDTTATVSGTTLTVSGSGSLKKSTLEDALAKEGISDVTTITRIRVEGNYSSIQNNVFDGFTALGYVFFTESISQVADDAFVNCSEEEVIVSNAVGRAFTGGLANTKIVNYMNADSVSEETKFEDGTLTLHLVPSEAVAGVIGNTSYTGLKVQIDEEEAQAVTMTKTSYGTIACTITGIDKTDFSITLKKGVAVTSDETYTVQGFDIQEDKTVYVNDVAITDTPMAGVDVEATVTNGETGGFYFTTSDDMPVGGWTTADNIYAAEGGTNGVFVNGEPTDVFLRKVVDNTYYVCLGDRYGAVQDGDKVSVSGCFYHEDVMIDFAPFTAECSVSDTTTWNKLTDTLTVDTQVSTVVDGAAEDGGNYILEGAQATKVGTGEVAATDDITVLYESGDYDIERTIGNVTFNKQVVVYKTGDANVDNVVDVKDLVRIKTGDYETTKSGKRAAETLVVGEETDKAALLRTLLVEMAESKVDKELPALEGATGAGQYAADYITDVDATANGTTVLSITDNEQNDYKSVADFDAYGLDYVMDFSFSTDREIRILQLTDTQIVDATQQRYEGRLDSASAALWIPENMEKLVFSYIKETVKQTQPDLILLTGDNIHGEFDDDGTLLTALINCMEELQIPWAPINGNHDNESIKGVAWQSEQYANAKYCLFNRRHAIGGNGNYSIGLAKNGELDRVVYMLDSNYCGANLTTKYEKHADYGTDNIYSMPKLIDTQMEWYRVSQLRVNQVARKTIPSFCCFHVPDAEIGRGLVWAGYQTVENETGNYTIGENGVIAQPGDSGYMCSSFSDALLNSMYPYMREVGCDGTFSGHLHYSSTSVYYKGIRWTLGTKTGEYVSHIPGRLGGTLISLEDNSSTGEKFVVEQIIVNPVTE